MALTNYQITQLFVILTTFFGIAAIILSIVMLCVIWWKGKDTTLIAECQCNSHVPDSVEFARGVKLSSTLRSDSNRAPNSDPLAQFTTNSYIKMSDIDETPDVL